MKFKILLEKSSSVHVLLEGTTKVLSIHRGPDSSWVVRDESGVKLCQSEPGFTPYDTTAKEYMAQQGMTRVQDVRKTLERTLGRSVYGERLRAIRSRLGIQAVQTPQGWVIPTADVKRLEEAVLGYYFRDRSGKHLPEDV